MYYSPIMYIYNKRIYNRVRSTHLPYLPQSAKLFICQHLAFLIVIIVKLSICHKLCVAFLHHSMLFFCNILNQPVGMLFLLAGLWVWCGCSDPPTSRLTSILRGELKEVRPGSVPQIPGLVKCSYCCIWKGVILT